MNKINSKVAVVSGATSGIGFEIVKQFLNQKIHTIAIGRRCERLKELEEEYGSLITIVKADISQRNILKKQLKNLPIPFQTPDYLINAAGLSLGFDEFADAQDEDWEVMVNTNIIGVLNLTSYFLPKIKERGTGHIINIGSIAAFYPYLKSNVYSGTKAFIHNFTLNLKSEFTGTNVKVTCLSPGMVKTEFALVRFKGDYEKANSFYKNYNVLTPKDIANTVMFCISQPEHVNITSMEIMSVDQPFHLGLGRKD